jgi:hypothetical protein
MGETRKKLPGIGTILAWLGVIGTILGIIGFFVSDLPALLRDEPPGLTEEQIVATLSALQDDKERAELQLTQIGLAEQSAANQSTQQAINQQQAGLQATLTVVAVEQAAFVATQNAIAAASATAYAEQLGATATADAANAAATEAALNITATAAALAQITPTATATPSPTPLPTPAPTPVPASDHRLVVGAVIESAGGGLLGFALQTNEPIPNTPEEGLTYVWLIDRDRDPLTGLAIQDIGVDMRVAARFADGQWTGTVRTVLSDGTLSDPPFVFADIKTGGPNLSFELDPSAYGLPDRFDWVARAELRQETYPFVPSSGHNTFER